MSDNHLRPARHLHPRVIAARLLRARTPPARLYAEYRDAADLYDHAHHEYLPVFRMGDSILAAAALDFRRSVLFGRDYLVAWIEDFEAFRHAVPAMDAVTSPVSVSWMPEPLPLILAPIRRRRNRGRYFLSVFEHEIVHVNQTIVGLRVPELIARTATVLVDQFFTYTQLEYEAYLIQGVRWPPPRLKFGKVTLSLEECALLRSHTSAIERILRATASGIIPATVLPRFLGAVPTEAPTRLRQIPCRRELVAWFRARWAHDVLAALRVIQSQGVDAGSKPLAPVRDWLRAQLKLPTRSST